MAKAAAHSWKHDDLMMDLAGYLMSDQRLVWTDMQLGPSGSPRPDVYVLEKSYSRPNPTAFEIKISRSDLRSDTTSGKWQSYLQYAGAVVFAVPDGLCTPADIPDGCGLIVRKAEVWRYARKPTRRAAEPNFQACMKLLMDGVSRVNQRREPRPRYAATWEENAAVRKKFGQAVAECARDLTHARQRLESARSQANSEWDRMRQDVENAKARLIAQAKSELETWAGLRREVITWLGLDENVSTWAVEQRIREMRRACDADQRVERAESEVTRARHAIQSALNALTPRDVAA
ncbi:MmcB family DNA repair protein [Sphingobium fuliginis]|uniref:MmcB family DNA repair protein n=1 Tax=Sphingobium fuliginis ATCC 27551 TaxID=1208342 RepID=A0A5B8CCV1_SPHSA|nr:MmcB family DNA repair protein [Sphingobium fuliginis]QDC37079.1 MmcB family DNA repair protein [Sphingobium fuliginis ATCC 27551]